ncbi:hypothetical protein BBJ28_00020235 [Nothophytophthora sp. Chile5]|nr:hypothetical protein BBJ28_00020235 [Nothophytophthora sp. Chile5]
MADVPFAVQEAIQAFVPEAGKRVVRAKMSEKSYVYKWGVRVVSAADDSATATWMCMASETCRTKGTKFLMCGGKTSKATKHLSRAHSIGSEKTASEVGKNQIRDEELAFVRQSPLYRDDPGRAYILMETLRIVYKTLPFRIGEYEETLLIRDLMLKEEARVAMNAKVIRHAVVELHDSTKREIQAMLAGNTIGSAKCFSIVADFWAARHDLFGATSDGGRDVKWMLKTGLNLRWEWCVLHFTHVAAKTAFGIVGDNSASKNPAMTDMLRRIIKTVYQTQQLEVMGTLFSELCNVVNEEDVNAHQLLNFRTHRFLGLTRVVRRILLLWGPLVAWYEERAIKVQRENVVPPASFPLARDKMELIQVLSLLEPISMLNQIGQAEAGNQCNVLLGLYKLRISLLDVNAPLKDCRSTATEKRFFRPDELSNIASTTRALLHKAFHRAFFRRYTERNTMNACSFAFEMQLLLHPNFTNPDGALKKVAIKANLQAGDSQQVAERHYTKVRRSVLNFWKRQQKLGNYRLLSMVARALFLMPSSSAQIERDFGTAGRIAPYNVDMATFLNCNKTYVNITQCPKLSSSTAKERVPSNVLVNMEGELDDEFGSLTNFFSNTSIDLGLIDDEDDGVQL